MNTKATFQYENYYHIYNKTHDGIKLFTEKRNYSFFLQRYKTYIHPYVRIHSYALLGNHFHFSIAVKTKEAIRRHVNTKPTTQRTGGIIKYLENTESESAIHELLVSQHQRFFISYSKAVNKASNRVGGLFKRPFKHSHFDPDVKFTYMQYYLHHNARKHGIVKTFDTYPYTSYHEILEENDWLLDLDEIWRHWDSKQEFVDFHEGVHYPVKFEGLLMEE